MTPIELKDFYSRVQVGFGYLVGCATVTCPMLGKLDREAEGNAGQLIGVLGVVSASANRF